MVKPASSRKAVDQVQTVFGLSQRSACRALGVSRATQRYQSRRQPNTMLLRIRSLAASRPRAGYRTLGRLLRREGLHVNDKRVYQVYREEGLTLRTASAPVCSVD